jgi:protein O-mannosyl-transferase
MVAGVVGGKWFLDSRPPPPPAIATQQLEPAAARLIEEHLGQVRARPRSGDAWGRLGAVLRLFDYREEATRCLAEAARRGPNNPQWPYFQALLLSHRAPQEALVKLRRAVALCGNHPPTPRLHLARWLAEAGQWQEAQDHLRELLRVDPQYSPALLTLAYAAQAGGELTNAVGLARCCTTNAYTARAAWTLLGALHQRLGETNAAFIASRKALTVSPDVPVPDPFEAKLQDLRQDARSLSDRAQQYLLAGKPDLAAPLVHRLVQEQPQFAETWLLLGRQQYLQKQPAAAEQALLRHLEMDPKSVNGHFQLGMSLLAQGRWAEAAAAFEKATLFKTDFGPAFFNLGFALAKAGRKAEAAVPFREAIRHNPEHLDSYILLADLCLQLGRTAEAVDLERRARDLKPEDPRLPVLRDRITRQQTN